MSFKLLNLSTDNFVKKSYYFLIILHIVENQKLLKKNATHRAMSERFNKKSSISLKLYDKTTKIHCQELCYLEIIMEWNGKLNCHINCTSQFRTTFTGIV
jgi:hypothetical protein